MFGGVIPAFEHRVFKAHPPLAREIVLLDEPHHFRNGPGLLYGHHLCALFRERIVQAHGQVALALVQKLFELGQHANGAEGNAFGAPGQAPGGGQDLYHPLHVVPVIQRLTHTHKYGIGKLLCLVNGKVLVQDVCRTQIAVETLSARHAELAAHLTTRLRTYTQRLPVIVRNHDGFDKRIFVMPGSDRASHRKQILPGSVLGGLHIDGGHVAHLVVLAKGFTASLGEVGHLINAPHPLLVQPLRHLLTRKRRQAMGLGNNCQLFRGFS